MNPSSEQQRGHEILQTPEYWWDVLKSRGQFWVSGMRWDLQIQALARETGEDIPGDPGLPYERLQGRYGGDGFRDYDVHTDGTPPPKPTYPHTNYLGHGYLCNNLLTYDDPKLASDTVGFSYGFFTRGLGDRGRGAASSFNFMLPKNHARMFIASFSQDPQLLERLFQSRYRALQFERIDDGILVVAENVEGLFKSESTRFGSKRDSRPESVRYREALDRVEQEDGWMTEHVKVHPFVMEGSEEPLSKEEQEERMKTYLTDVHRQVVEHHRELREVLARAEQSEKPLVNRLIRSIRSVSGSKRTDKRK